MTKAAANGVDHDVNFMIDAGVDAEGQRAPKRARGSTSSRSS
jgi:hypothetical protein